MLDLRGLGGLIRGPIGPGGSFGMVVKSRDSAGSEAWAGLGEQGACRPIEAEIEVCGECDGDEYRELVCER